MTKHTAALIRDVTTELNDEVLRDRLRLDDEPIFRPVPYPGLNDHTQPVWRICLALAFDTSARIGLDVNGEVIMGRGENDTGFVGLFNDEGVENLGLSRQHAMLRPSETKLYILDLGSTNGTWLNGHLIGVNVPYKLSHGDHLRLGRLELTVKIIDTPSMHTRSLKTRATLADSLASLAQSIVSELDRDRVLSQALEAAETLTDAHETSIWLVDELSGEVFLEKQHGGSKNQQILRLPIANSMVGRVIQSGKPLIANRDDEFGQQIKVKTGYLVEAIIYVPLILGGVVHGVLAAVHREPGKIFTEREQQVLVAIADFTAIAIHNTRVFQAADAALSERTKAINALNYTLTYNLKALTNSVIGYAGLLTSYDNLAKEATEIAGDIAVAGNRMARLVDQLIQITELNSIPLQLYAPCDLVDAVTKAINACHRLANEKSVQVNFQIEGEPFIIRGDPTYLYRSIYNLIVNAVSYSPHGAQVVVALEYSGRELVIRVRDAGPGIPEADLPYLFEGYFRRNQLPESDTEDSVELGLEITRAIVEGHRGSITAQNTGETGAEFIITLPALRYTPSDTQNNGEAQS